ncbi:thiamine pyrophosphate-dependent dehydrogenase E1 component subunit alpha [Streptomyces sulphureus]|uniref:thiamine pyrophosphate-dependent dehydrogenase E1 component subunit alpha n=1 Tax=Streptomyces sulphureus TaxID=47758 RepID=UPI000365B990|nr:thiamine pyrophosphate-dependent dehydrogenase E1 component subunit alpha [Streptomyces sulphureus]
MDRPPAGAEGPALRMYRVMAMIRAFEERVGELAKEIPGAVHLYIGQEAVAAGVCSVLRDGDHLASTHRGHGHAIAAGCEVEAMAAELYGRSDGVCNGKGGSMHIADLGHGMLGANGLAGGGVPLACGAALTARQRGTDDVAVAFTGDGGANQGAVLESLVLARMLDLPVVFVVENNGYAQATSAARHFSGTDMSARAAGFGIPGAVVDGADALAVRDAASEAVDRARSGRGPTLVECRAQRFHGHMEGWDNQAYRPAGEAERLRAEADPLALLRRRLTGAGQPADAGAELDRVEKESAARVQAAFDRAAQPAEPLLTALTTDVYAAH